MKRVKHSTLLRAVASSDVNFHYALYGWLISQDFIEQLLDIQSPFLEQFLASKRDELAIADYLCRFFVRNNRFFDAAQLLSCVSHYPNLTLNERIGFLTNAITNARSSSKADTQEILSQLTDELDVARVQSEIMAQLNSIPDTQDSLQELNYDLLDIGQLFSRYARRYNLYETMLYILFISDHSGEKSQIIIEDCWNSIIRKSLHSSPLESLSDKVKELGNRFYPDENVFNLKYLISKLENLTLERDSDVGVDRNWVSRAMLDIKVPHARIFAVYQDLYDAKLPPWSSNKSLVYLIENILFVIEQWFEYIRSPTVSVYERDEFPARIVDEALSKYLVGVPHSNKSLLMDQLQAVQSRVRTFY